MRTLASFLAYLWLRGVGASSRVLWLGRHRARTLEDSGKPFLYALWHSRQALLADAHRGEPVCVLVSRSKDGAVIAGALERLGLSTARGSSSRGGSTALLELAAAAERGLRPAFTPDGPKGPARKVKPGALFLAQKLGLPILPLSAAAARRKVFERAWDRFELPYPFNRIVIAHGEPVTVGPDDDLDAKARELEERLEAATAEAEALARSKGGGGVLAFYAAVFPLGLVGLFLKMLVSPRRGLLLGMRQELTERLALYGAPGSDRQVLWVHAASVGEVKSVAPLVDGLRALVQRPYVLVTCTTRAGRLEASRLKGVDEARLAPFDAPWVVRRFLQARRPVALVLAETEIWPHSLLLARESGAKVLLVNGRMSAKSARNYRFLAPVLREVLAGFDRLLVQTQADADRFIALGARSERVSVVGNLKHDLPPAVREPEAVERMGWKRGEAPLWVAGSTRAGEDEILLDAYKRLRARHPKLRLVLVPRHVERASRVAGLLDASGLRWKLWSRAAQDPSGPAPDVALVDEMGHLMDLYAAADAAFVGGTLTPRGGHNLLEPASLGKPVVFGPHVETVQDLAAALRETGGGAETADAEALAAVLDRWLSDASAREKAGQAALAARARFQGAARRSLELLQPLLKS